MATVFVFGSNLAGRHGKGAALTARNDYGAEYGVGKGRTGNAYALPTKDENLRTLPMWAVDRHVSEFVAYAAQNQSDTFLLTPVGTGLAGHDKREIWGAFARHRLPRNILLTASWMDNPEATP